MMVGVDTNVESSLANPLEPKALGGKLGDCLPNRRKGFLAGMGGLGPAGDGSRLFPFSFGGVSIVSAGGRFSCPNRGGDIPCAIPDDIPGDVHGDARSTTPVLVEGRLDDRLGRIFPAQECFGATASPNNTSLDPRLESRSESEVDCDTGNDGKSGIAAWGAMASIELFLVCILGDFGDTVGNAFSGEGSGLENDD